MEYRDNKQNLLKIEQILNIMNIIIKNIIVFNKCVYRHLFGD